MRKIICFSFLVFYNILFSQLSNTNDTLAVDKFGTKIELEPNLAKCEVWNNQLVAICKSRMNLVNLDSKVKLYYKNSYLASLITSAFLEEQKGNVKKAINVYLQVLKELEKNKNNKLLGYTYGAVAASFSNEGEYEKALFYTRKAIPFAIKETDKSNIANLYNSMGYLLNKKKDFANSSLYYDKSIDIRKIRKDSSSLANSICNKGTNYMDTKDYNKAEKCFNEAIILNEYINDYNQLSINYANLSRIESIRKNKSKELHYTLKSYDFSVKGKNLNTQLSMSKNLYDYYKSTNNDPLALKYLEKNIEINKIVNKEENKNAVLKAEFNYETEKKEAKIKALSQQKKIANLESQRQKTITLILGITLISLIVTSYFLFNRYKIKKQNELLKSQLIQAQKTIEAEKKATESELKALKSQMNPHFIFNALTSIQDQFMFGDKVIASEQMGNFTYLTRQVLNVSGKKQILLSTEIDLLSKYLELEKMRFTTDFEYEINLLGNIDKDYHEIPPMLIQPFVENSIKHGLLHKNGLKKIQIDFDLAENEEYIICTVIDNGIGRQKSAEIKAKNHATHNSFSTIAIEQRLELLNEKLQFPDLITYCDLVSNENEIKGTQVVIKIPIV